MIKEEKNVTVMIHVVLLWSYVHAFTDGQAWSHGVVKNFEDRDKIPLPIPYSTYGSNDKQFFKLANEADIVPRYNIKYGNNLMPLKVKYDTKNKYFEAFLPNTWASGDNKNVGQGKENGKAVELSAVEFFNVDKDDKINSKNINGYKIEFDENHDAVQANTNATFPANESYYYVVLNNLNERDDSLGVSATTCPYDKIIENKNACNYYFVRDNYFNNKRNYASDNLIPKVYENDNLQLTPNYIKYILGNNLVNVNNNYITNKPKANKDLDLTCTTYFPFKNDYNCKTNQDFVVNPQEVASDCMLSVPNTVNIAKINNSDNNLGEIDIMRDYNLPKINDVVYAITLDHSHPVDIEFLDPNDGLYGCNTNTQQKQHEEQNMQCDIEHLHKSNSNFNVLGQPSVKIQSGIESISTPETFNYLIDRYYDFGPAYTNSNRDIITGNIDSDEKNVTGSNSIFFDHIPTDLEYTITNMGSSKVLSEEIPNNNVIKNNMYATPPNILPHHKSLNKTPKFALNWNEASETRFPYIWVFPSSDNNKEENKKVFNDIRQIKDSINEIIPLNDNYLYNVNINERQNDHCISQALEFPVADGKGQVLENKPKIIEDKGELDGSQINGHRFANVGRDSLSPECLIVTSPYDNSYIDPLAKYIKESGVIIQEIKNGNLPMDPTALNNYQEIGKKPGFNNFNYELEPTLMKTHQNCFQKPIQELTNFNNELIVNIRNDTYLVNENFQPTTVVNQFGTDNKLDTFIDTSRLKGVEKDIQANLNSNYDEKQAKETDNTERIVNNIYTIPDGHGINIKPCNFELSDDQIDYNTNNYVNGNVGTEANLYYNLNEPCPINQEHYIKDSHNHNLEPENVAESSYLTSESNKLNDMLKVNEMVCSVPQNTDNLHLWSNIKPNTVAKYDTGLVKPDHTRPKFGLKDDPKIDELINAECRNNHKKNIYLDNNKNTESMVGWNTHTPILKKPDTINKNLDLIHLDNNCEEDGEYSMPKVQETSNTKVLENEILKYIPVNIPKLSKPGSVDIEKYSYIPGWNNIQLLNNEMYYNIPKTEKTGNTLQDNKIYNVPRFGKKGMNMTKDNTANSVPITTIHPAYNNQNYDSPYSVEDNLDLNARKDIIFHELEFIKHDNKNKYYYLLNLDKPNIELKLDRKYGTDFDTSPLVANEKLKVNIPVNFMQTGKYTTREPEDKLKIPNVIEYNNTNPEAIETYSCVSDVKEAKKFQNSVMSTPDIPENIIDFPIIKPSLEFDKPETIYFNTGYDCIFPTAPKIGNADACPKNKNEHYTPEIDRIANMRTKFDNIYPILQESEKLQSTAENVYQYQTPFMESDKSQTETYPLNYVPNLVDNNIQPEINDGFFNMPNKAILKTTENNRHNYNLPYKALVNKAFKDFNKPKLGNEGLANNKDSKRSEQKELHNPLIHPVIENSVNIISTVNEYMPGCVENNNIELIDQNLEYKTQILEYDINEDKDENKYPIETNNNEINVEIDPIVQNKCSLEPNFDNEETSSFSNPYNDKVRSMYSPDNYLKEIQYFDIPDYGSTGNLKTVCSTDTDDNGLLYKPVHEFGVQISNNTKNMDQEHIPIDLIKYDDYEENNIRIEKENFCPINDKHSQPVITNTNFEGAKQVNSTPYLDPELDSTNTFLRSDNYPDTLASFNMDTRDAYYDFTVPWDQDVAQSDLPDSKFDVIYPNNIVLGDNTDNTKISNSDIKYLNSIKYNNNNPGGELNQEEIQTLQAHPDPKLGKFDFNYKDLKSYNYVNINDLDQNNLELNKPSFIMSPLANDNTNKLEGFEIGKNILQFKSIDTSNLYLKKPEISSFEPITLQLGLPHSVYTSLELDKKQKNMVTTKPETQNNLQSNEDYLHCEHLRNLNSNDDVSEKNVANVNNKYIEGNDLDEAILMPDVKFNNDPSIYKFPYKHWNNIENYQQPILAKGLLENDLLHYVPLLPFHSSSVGFSYPRLYDLHSKPLQSDFFTPSDLHPVATYYNTFSQTNISKVPLTQNLVSLVPVPERAAQLLRRGELPSNTNLDFSTLTQDPYSSKSLSNIPSIPDTEISSGELIFPIAQYLDSVSILPILSPGSGFKYQPNLNSISLPYDFNYKVDSNFNDGGQEIADFDQWNGNSISTTKDRISPMPSYTTDPAKQTSANQRNLAPIPLQQDSCFTTHFVTPESTQTVPCLQKQYNLTPALLDETDQTWIPCNPLILNSLTHIQTNCEQNPKFQFLESPEPRLSNSNPYKTWTLNEPNKSLNPALKMLKHPSIYPNIPKTQYSNTLEQFSFPNDQYTPKFNHLNLNSMFKPQDLFLNELASNGEIKEEKIFPLNEDYNSVVPIDINNVNKHKTYINPYYCENENILSKNESPLKYKLPYTYRAQLQNIINNIPLPSDKPISIPLGQFVTHYPNETSFNFRINEPALDLYGWYSKIKFVKARLILESQNSNILNFRPILKSKIEPDKVQNTVVNILREYGRPVIMNERNSQFFLDSSNDLKLNERFYLLWPAYCNY